MKSSEPNHHVEKENRSAWTCFWVFLRLGLTSFGGPVAHLGFFREEFVAKRKWLSEQAYADLVALCQFLPGPASSQVGFALGYQRAGLAGAFASWFAFTLPSAVVMIAAAYGIAFVETDAAWLQGLKIAAVAVVAHAVWGMATKLCPDRNRATVALLAAGVVLAVGTAWIQVMVIALGLAVGLLCFRSLAEGQVTSPAEGGERVHRGLLPKVALALVLLGFVGFPLVAWLVKDPWWQMVDGFYRSGLLVFGGGHVVLPLLEAETVGRGWMDQDSFLAGYGAAQALPGPLFTLAAYLGTIIAPGGPAWLGGVVALVAILLPSMFLVIGTLPYWDRLRSLPGARAALIGANAAVVGILLAALYNPVFLSGVTSVPAMILALLAFGALQFWKLPAWALVGLCAAVGAVVL
ncbi:MAG: chromate efflux transporter [Opitutales bacterium]|nr:chromate efflux transporter [Opitutales bacterium]